MEWSMFNNPNYFIPASPSIPQMRDQQLNYNDLYKFWLTSMLTLQAQQQHQLLATTQFPLAAASSTAHHQLPPMFLCSHCVTCQHCARCTHRVAPAAPLHNITPSFIQQLPTNHPTTTSSITTGEPQLQQLQQLQQQHVNANKLPVLLQPSLSPFITQPQHQPQPQPPTQVQQPRSAAITPPIVASSSSPTEHHTEYNGSVVTPPQSPEVVPQSSKQLLCETDSPSASPRETTSPTASSSSISPSTSPSIPSLPASVRSSSPSSPRLSLDTTTQVTQPSSVLRAASPSGSRSAPIPTPTSSTPTPTSTSTSPTPPTQISSRPTTAAAVAASPSTTTAQEWKVVSAVPKHKQNQSSNNATTVAASSTSSTTTASIPSTVTSTPATKPQPDKPCHTMFIGDLDSTVSVEGIEALVERAITCKCYRTEIKRPAKGRAFAFVHFEDKKCYDSCVSLYGPKGLRAPTIDGCPVYVRGNK